MDESVKPGDRKPRPIEQEPEKVSAGCFALKYIGWYLLFILSFPLLVVFYLPVTYGIEAGRKCYSANGRNPLAAILGFLCAFILMFVLNACFSPILVVIGLFFIVAGPIIGLGWLCSGCKVPDNGYRARKEARERNEKLAEERMKAAFNKTES